MTYITDATRTRRLTLLGALVAWMVLAPPEAPAHRPAAALQDTTAAADTTALQDTTAATDTTAAQSDTARDTARTASEEAAAEAEPAATGRTGQQDAGTTAASVDTVYRVEPRPRPAGELSESLRDLRSALERVGRGAARAAADLALVVHDDYTVSEDETVDGNLALVGGELELEGTVRGDVLVFAGRLQVEPSARITGDLLQVGGEVERDGGEILGEFLSVGFEAADDNVIRVRPPSPPSPPSPPRIDVEFDDWDFWPDFGRGRGFFWGMWHSVWEGIGGLFTTFSFWLVLALLGAGWMYFAPENLEATADTARHNFGRSFLVGLAGQFLFLPAIVALAIGIITAVLIPFFILAVCLAHFMGYLAVAHAAGAAAGGREMGWTVRLPWAGSRFRHMLTGLLLLLGLFAAGSLLQIFGGLFEPLVVLSMLAATFITWLAFTAGFGAVLLSRAGTRRDWAFARRSAGTGDLFDQPPARGGGETRSPEPDQSGAQPTPEPDQSGTQPGPEAGETTGDAGSEPRGEETGPDSTGEDPERGSHE